MDLLLDITSRGRPPRAVRAEIVRALVPADLAMLSIERGIEAPRIKQLRDHHHAIARLVAKGHSGAEIAAITGYGQSRISILKADPAFAELVEFYRRHIRDIQDEIEADEYATITAIEKATGQIVLDRVLDEPDSVSLDLAAELHLKYAALTGKVAVSRSVTANLKLDLAEELTVGRARVSRFAATGPETPSISGPEGTENDK